MELCSQIVDAVTRVVNEERFTANLVAVHVGVGVLIVATFLLRRLLPRRSTRLAALDSAGHEDALEHWFAVLERFAVAAVRLAGLWAAGRLVGLGQWADDVIGFVLRVATILVVTRLLVLACRALSRTGAEMGNRH